MAVASGANMNFDRLRFVAERAELGEQREAVLAVTIPEKPGSFRKFSACSATATSPSSTTATPTDAARPHLRRRHRAQPQRGRTPGRDARAPRAACARPHRRRDGQVARAPHGGRTRHRQAGKRAAVPLRVPRAPGRADELPPTLRSGLEHLACSTTATTAPTSAACWSACMAETDNPAYRMFLSGS